MYLQNWDWHPQALRMPIVGSGWRQHNDFGFGAERAATDRGWISSTVNVATDGRWACFHINVNRRGAWSFHGVYLIRMDIWLLPDQGNDLAAVSSVAAA